MFRFPADRRRSSSNWSWFKVLSILEYILIVPSILHFNVFVVNDGIVSVAVRFPDLFQLVCPFHRNVYHNYHGHWQNKHKHIRISRSIALHDAVID